MLSGLDDRLVFQGAYYRDLREVGRGARGPRRARALRPDRDGRPPPDPAPALVARAASPGTVAPVVDRAATRGSQLTLLPRRTRQMRRFYRENFPSRRAPGRLAAALPQRVVARVRGAGLRALAAWPRRGSCGRSRRWTSSRATACSRSAAGTAWPPRSCARRAAGSVTAIDRSAKMIALATRRNQAHVAAGRARFETVALEQADFGGERFDKVFGVHVAALWRSGRGRVVRAHLAPGGALLHDRSAAGPADAGRRAGVRRAGDGGAGRARVHGRGAARSRTSSRPRSSA